MYLLASRTTIAYAKFFVVDNTCRTKPRRRCNVGMCCRQEAENSIFTLETGQLFFSNFHTR